MSKLNKDILFLLFKELQDDSKSLFSCLMVNKLWCETVIPILWKNPWRYNINYYKKSSLYYIITFYLTDDIKKFLESQGIQLPQSLHKSLLFDYLSFCKSINVNIIRSIIYFGYSLDYCKFLLEQELYNILIRKCSELKYLDMRSIEHQIFYFPEAKVRLDSLCELKCNMSINPSFFYGLSYICKNIQRLIIVNTVIKENPGIVKLIEVQNNLKYFEWEDGFDDSEDFFGDPYGEIFLTLAKRSDTLNHLIIFFQYFYEYEHELLQKLLTELHKLKTLKIKYIYIDLCIEEKLRTLIYHNNDLEVFNIDYITMETSACIIENNRGQLKEILFLQEPYYRIGNDDSLILMHKIYENCPLVEYLSLAFPPSKEHFTEFKKLLKACQNLKSLLLIIPNIYEMIGTREKYENGGKLLGTLIESAPMNLREIRSSGGFKFSLEALETFLEKWKGRPALSVFTSDAIYNEADYINLINKYKSIGIIKDFSWKVNLYF